MTGKPRLRLVFEIPLDRAAAIAFRSAEAAALDPEPVLEPVALVPVVELDAEGVEMMKKFT